MITSGDNYTGYDRMKIQWHDTSAYNNNYDYWDAGTSATTQFININPMTITIDGGTARQAKMTYEVLQAAIDDVNRGRYPTDRYDKKRYDEQFNRFIPPEPPKRRQAPREFNKYINGSDLMEEFIRYCGTLGVRQGEIMEIPIDSFIKWLIIEACVLDKEEPEVTLELGPAPQPRCLGCGRYVPRSLPMPLHDERCAGFHFARQRKQMEVAHAQGARGSSGDDRRVLSSVGAPGS